MIKDPWKYNLLNCCGVGHMNSIVGNMLFYMMVKYIIGFLVTSFFYAWDTSSPWCIMSQFLIHCNITKCFILYPLSLPPFHRLSPNLFSYPIYLPYLHPFWEEIHVFQTHLSSQRVTSISFLLVTLHLND